MIHDPLESAMRATVLRSLCCLICLAAPAWAQQPDAESREPAAANESSEPGPEDTPGEAPAAEQSPPDSALPSFADLEAAGAVIGEIRINPQNIFDLEDPKENYLLYRIANALHVVTRPNVVRETLLFKTGDRLSVRLIEESERLLRATLQVYGVSIRPIAYRDGVVDLEVRTRDRWTLDLGFGFSRTGGVNSDRVSLKEGNLLGSGISVGLSRKSDVDRTSTTISLTDPHAFGPFTSASYSYANAADGKSQSFVISRPFFALDSRQTAGASMDRSERNEPVYVSGLNTGVYRHTQMSAGLFAGWSAGLVDGWARRHSVGFSYQDNTYQSIPGQSPAGELPSDLTLAFPYYRFEIIQDRFRTETNLNQIGKPEDLTIGLLASVQLGRSFTALGSTREQWVYATSLAKGYEFMNTDILLGSASLSGRYAGGSEEQRSSAGAQYFHRRGNGYTFYASIAGDVARNPDVPNSVVLGGDNGLRGYPLRYQSGEKKALLTLEERVYTDWNPFRLIRIGGAVFYDIGRAWGGSNPNTANPGWLSDVGFGLRFLSDRSAVGNVLHVDFAFPLNREPGVKSFQLLVHTKVTL